MSSPVVMESEGEDPQVAEAQVPKGLPAPDMPTRTQREIHARTHLPYRVWCDICVQGRGQASPHQAPDATADRYMSPQLHLDYWFIGGQGETGRESLPVLVMYEKLREVLFAHRVEQKGTYTAIVKQLCDDQRFKSVPRTPRFSGKPSCRFLSVFKWEPRKNWRVLLYS